MSILTNGVNRVPLFVNPSNVVDIDNATQMPLTLAADGNMRWKPVLSTKYIFHAGTVLPLVELPEATSSVSPQVIEFTTANQADPVLILGSTTPHIWGRNNNAIALRFANIVDVSPQSTRLFDLVGGSPFSFLGINNSLVANIKDLGTLVDMAMNIQTATLVDYERGLVSRNNGATPFPSAIGNTRIANLNAITTQTAAFCFMGGQSTVAINTGNIEIDASDSALCIDSGGSGSYDIIGNSYDGVGDFFTAAISESITVFANVDIAITSFSDSVANPGTHTDLNFAAATNVIRGQTILIADEAAYDGLQVVTSVSDDQLRVEIEVVFSTSGAGTLKRTQITSTSHGLVRDQTNTISGTTSYNGTTEVLQVVDDNDFVIPVAFVADDATGTVVATSKDQTDIGVVAELNGKATNSRAIGFGEMNANTNLTSITDGTYAAVDVTGTVENVVTERFELTTAAIGLFTYLGEKDITGTIVAIVTAIKAGSTENYRFAVSVNGAVPVFASASYAPMEVKTTKVAATILKPVFLVQNDTIQIMSAGDGSADDLTITDFVIDVTGA